MSGISAYLYGTNPPKTDANKDENHQEDPNEEPQVDKENPFIVNAQIDANDELKEEEKEETIAAKPLSQQSESQKFHDFDPANFNLEKDTEVVVPEEVGV